MSDSMSNYGVTPTGFTRMRLAEVRAFILSRLEASLGFSLETDPNSVTSQIVDPFADIIATMWEKAEGVYLSQFPVTAEGISLDLAVSYAGVKRLTETQSYVTATVYGTEGTYLAAGSQAKTSPEGDVFSLDTAVQITALAASYVEFTVGTPVAGGNHGIVLNGVTYSYVVPAGGATAEQVAQVLSNAALSAGFDSEHSGNIVKVYRSDLTTFSAVRGGITPITAIGVPALFRSVAYGEVPIEEGALSTIVTTTPGWTSITNTVRGTEGRDMETDEELRARYAAGVYRLGAGTMPSMSANIAENVPGVESLRIYENLTNAVDAEGRPPGAIEVVIEGGSPSVIAAEIFRIKPLGNPAWGTTMTTVTDSVGNIFSVGFSRPTPKYVWIKYNLLRYSEETMPADALATVTQAIADYGETLGVGVDVITQRFWTPILGAIAGIAKIEVYTALTSSPLTAPDESAYTIADKPIGNRERARFDPSRISGAVVTS